uniref:Uncharacterized protein n=1 Tax=Cacopsylla melanoneura TaxID=428564 RepID=A0A8D8TYI9_9HEMI
MGTLLVVFHFEITLPHPTEILKLSKTIHSKKGHSILQETSRGLEHEHPKVGVANIRDNLTETTLGETLLTNKAEFFFFNPTRTNNTKTQDPTSNSQLSHFLSLAAILEVKAKPKLLSRITKPTQAISNDISNN